MTNQEVLAGLFETKKGHVLIGSAWEGYLAGGRGCVMTDLNELSYVPLVLARRFHKSVRSRLVRLIKAYDPRSELVLMLALPVAPNSLGLSVSRCRPAVAPEEAFLSSTGMEGYPPMQVVPFPVSERSEVSLGDRVA